MRAPGLQDGGVSVFRWDVGRCPHPAGDDRAIMSCRSGQECPMPLGFEARSHACQRRFGRQRQSGGPFPLTPTLSPEEREPRWPRYEPAGAHDMRKPGLASPSPGGEGRGEGELCSRRFHAASSYEHFTLQTRGQILAALRACGCARYAKAGLGLSLSRGRGPG